MSEASSPSSRRTAMTALTFTPSVPSATTSFPTVPSSTASTSMVALSVSISAIRSPAETVSPSLTSQRASVPSSMVGESAGMVTSIGIASLPILHDRHRGELLRPVVAQHGRVDRALEHAMMLAQRVQHGRLAGVLALDQGVDLGARDGDEDDLPPMPQLQVPFVADQAAAFDLHPRLL